MVCVCVWNKSLQEPVLIVRMIIMNYDINATLFLFVTGTSDVKNRGDFRSAAHTEFPALQ